MKSLFKKKQEPSAIAVQTRNSFYSFPSLRDYIPQNFGELQLYDQLRQMVPIIDAAIDKILRLMGSFRYIAVMLTKEAPLQNFLQTVQVNATSCGLERFCWSILTNCLLTAMRWEKLFCRMDKLRPFTTHLYGMWN